MQTLIILSALAILFTKFLDCHSTATRLSHPGAERNRWMRPLILRFGIKTVVWTVFALTVFITVAAAIIAWLSPGRWCTSLFVCFAIIVSITQAAVAHTNYTKRLNAITRFLITKKHNRF